MQALKITVYLHYAKINKYVQLIVLNLNLNIVHTIFIPKSHINDNKNILSKHIQGRKPFRKAREGRKKDARKGA